MVTLHIPICGVHEFLYVYNTIFLSMDLTHDMYVWKKYFAHSNGH